MPADRMWLAILAVCSAAILGCGNDREMIPVSGRITYGGGSWPKSGNITFAPLEASGSTPLRPGAGAFKEDGAFVVGSYRPGDGLRPGKYHVIVSCVDVDTGVKIEHVPADFKTEELVIEPGQDDIELNFDVPKK
jgi:hypothetical protein